MEHQNRFISQSSAKQRTTINSTNSSQKKSKKIKDRMIPRVSWSDYQKIQRESQRSKSKDKQSCYQLSLEKSLFSEESETMSVRSFAICESQKKEGKSSIDKKQGCVKRPLHIKPFKEYQVGQWKDNYYSSLLDWGYNNFLVTGGWNRIHFRNMSVFDDHMNHVLKTYEFKKVKNMSITSIKQSPNQPKIAMGYSNGAFKIFDYFKQKQVFFSKNWHKNRIATIAWQDMLITGSKDQQIKILDIRSKEKQISESFIEPRSHTQQVCGLALKGNLLASGGNDNLVYIYDLRKFQILDGYQHDAAVKALTWLKDSKVLVSGGGTADKKLKFWKEGQGVYQQTDTGSQVCNLISSSTSKEIVSCQGFSLNQIVLWDYDGNRVKTLYGHKSRVLYSCLSPQGDCFASGAGDQMLKIWKVFPKQQNQYDFFTSDLR